MSAFTQKRVTGDGNIILPRPGEVAGHQFKLHSSCVCTNLYYSSTLALANCLLAFLSSNMQKIILPSMITVQIVQINHHTFSTGNQISAMVRNIPHFFLLQQPKMFSELLLMWASCPMGKTFQEHFRFPWRERQEVRFCRWKPSAYKNILVDPNQYI